MTDLNRTPHDEIAYESWLRRHETAAAVNAGSGATEVTTAQATR